MSVCFAGQKLRSWRSRLQNEAHMVILGLSCRTRHAVITDELLKAKAMLPSVDLSSELTVLRRFRKSPNIQQTKIQDPQDPYIESLLDRQLHLSHDAILWRETALSNRRDWK